jgi:hypothetical protein
VAGSRRAAFSLIEILVTVALLTVIILGLFAVFNQTQRVFRATMNSTDVLEAGRAINGNLARELEQVTPSDANMINFYAQLINAKPAVQSLPGTTVGRINLLSDVFFLMRDNQSWVGVGYCVRVPDDQGRLWLPETARNNGQLGAGYLYRYSSTLPVLVTNTGFPNVGTAQNPQQIYNDFLAASTPGSSLISNRVCDGVIHFYLRAMDTNGWPIVLSRPPVTTIVTNNPNAPGEVWSCAYYSNAVPAFIQMELGILEPRAFIRYNNLGDATARLNYLKRDDIASRVQIFRQRIPVRNMDPTAFQ